MLRKVKLRKLLLFGIFVGFDLFLSRIVPEPMGSFVNGFIVAMIWATLGLKYGIACYFLKNSLAILVLLDFSASVDFENFMKSLYANIKSITPTIKPPPIYIVLSSESLINILSFYLDSRPCPFLENMMARFSKANYSTRRITPTEIPQFFYDIQMYQLVIYAFVQEWVVIIIIWLIIRGRFATLPRP